MVHTIHVIEKINAPIEQIWEIVGPYNGLAAYHPAIKASRIENNHLDQNNVGNIRYLTLEEGFVRERLLKFDAKQYNFEYEIIEGTIPVENYKAGVRLSRETNETTLCEWWADFKVMAPATTEELIPFIAENVFRAGFQAAAQYCRVEV